MNTVNASTGFTPFQLKSNFSPRLIPSLINREPSSLPTNVDVLRMVQEMEINLMEAKDNLLTAKISQAHHANKSRAPEKPYAVGDKVLLTTVHRRWEYMQKKDGRVTKFMPRFDGPYTIAKAHPATSSYTLDLPESSSIFPTFHASQLQPFHPNDNILFPHRQHDQPGPIITPDGEEEYFVDSIVDEQKRGRSWQYLVQWSGYGPEADLWRPAVEMKDTVALDKWLTNRGD
ncbi:hypothetical protein Hypma_007676 [Hypsizygus marmoreus]|uniref:Chromo domain-containing protein n=1 Tax=Hypsizygus marmoreus TaxID=39966 RepID=A0A369JRN0_HYPMA|nr:hypothetical protein Hypma_007676 [Hypsizygus marmoreus]